ncbi:Serine/threonine-protein kinase/endoribonuclease ire-1 [Orchesella cincta]|uniref:Serine/threonine-protein kinase/endoribonuclease ire-1 n=1 Tax=Orchesella cincta TaxID=48709 RepID=A0A1D2N929_ORCCI|nr:Serine/threonine-protein kinase/endoribonuclease ire-1 [Orchesella cincta]
MNLTDYWLQLNPFTGEKTEIHGEETCPAWSSSRVNEDSCSADNPKRLVLKNLLIGKTEYTLSMMDGPRKWNVTYHHYSSKDMNPQSLLDYDLVHFTSPSVGSLMTYDRLSGELLYHRELESPVIGMYSIDGTTTNLVSVPFNPIASDTLNRLKNTNTENNKHLSPTTYVGECAYGLYAVPALLTSRCS